MVAGRDAISPTIRQGEALPPSGAFDLTEMPVIFIIDDDPSMRTAIHNLLRSLGYEVQVHASAEAFLQSGPSVQPWCIITDVRMPGMSGVELQTRLRSGGSDVPFVFITAVPEEADSARAFSDGALCFLTKPVDEDALIQCLEMAVARRRDPQGK